MATQHANSLGELQEVVLSELFLKIKPIGNQKEGDH